MHKLSRASNGYLSSFLGARSKNPTLSLASLFHQRSDKLDYVLAEVGELQTLSKPPINVAVTRPESDSDEEGSVQISHPWPEWVDLMECLLKRGYFRADGNPFRNGDLGHKESKVIRRACLNFARDRFDLIRFVSRKDIQIIAACGCPSLDRKVVNSGKRLRAHVGIDEGDICRSCNLRGDCDRAYVKAREDEGGRTVDVMRFLLTYGLNPISGTVENKPCLNKAVKESVRVLLKQVVEYSTRTLDSDPPKSRTWEEVAPVNDRASSQEKGHVNVTMKQGDWLCPKCNFLNFTKNIKCLRCDGFSQEKLNRLKEDQDHLPLKKGDWICDKCNFLNFARNTRCLQCKEKPSKRQINPGEWECPSCNYINFSRNMVCLKCDHKRPKATRSLNTAAENHMEDPGFQENRRLRFDGRDSADVNTQIHAQRQNRNHNTHMWRSLEENSEEQVYPNLRRKEASDFVDFPIAGGKSDLSKNGENRERWKSEMVERSKGKVMRDDEFGSPTIPRMLGLPKSTDDEEMAEWFSPGSEREFQK